MTFILSSLLAPPLAAETPANAPPAAASATVVLDTAAFWRMHDTLKPPVIRSDKAAKPIFFQRSWLNQETPGPAPGWPAPFFDDHAWSRELARGSCSTPFLARVCLRGKFTVTDPAQVSGLSLSVSYRGGVIVYLNGKEVARRNVPKGSGDDLLAEPYPPDTFTPVRGWGASISTGPRPEAPDMRVLRNRTLENLPLPPAELRPGVNVLAVEIIRAPYDPIVQMKSSERFPCDLDFNTCELESIRLSANGATGLVPAATRPPGFQAWNSNLLAADYDLDFGDPTEPLQPIDIVAARNGSFSGKIVLGDNKPIHALAASVTALRGPHATIPAANIHLRYGLPGGDHVGDYYSTYDANPGCARVAYPRAPTALAMLAESPPADIPVRTVAARSRDPGLAQAVAPVFGAVTPLWVTVDVPRNTPPGDYQADITVSAKDVQPLHATVHLHVTALILPDPQDDRTWVELLQSPSTLQEEYNVPLWSDRHFALIAKSMTYLHDVGSRVIHIPLIAQTNFGNAESMVRWIEKGNKRYDFDFSIMDRYLDAAEKFMGTPKIVCFNVWDVYLCSKELNSRPPSHADAAAKLAEMRSAFVGKGPLVTLLDPTAGGNGKAETATLPPYTDPDMKRVWKSLFDQLRERLKKRGLEKTMMLGFLSDAVPSAEENAVIENFSGGLPWVQHSHFPITNGRLGADAVAIAVGNRKIAYQTHINSMTMPWDMPADQIGLGGWKRPDLYAMHDRGLDMQPGTRWLLETELNIVGGQRGLGWGGADLWLLKDKKGTRNWRIWRRYPLSVWPNLDLPWALLAPGPDGPLATASFELFREGVEDCEARIIIERALDDPALKARLGNDLAHRCTQTLLTRNRAILLAGSTLNFSHSHGYATFASDALHDYSAVAGHFWYLGSNWQGRTETLYSLAAEVQKSLAQ